jgi:hypothetical protein
MLIVRHSADTPENNAVAQLARDTAERSVISDFATRFSGCWRAIFALSDFIEPTGGGLTVYAEQAHSGRDGE